jgi:hypothetical protein
MHKKFSCAGSRAKFNGVKPGKLGKKIRKLN